MEKATTSMDSFALDLSSLIIHLEYQRKRVLENPYTRPRMCFCRSAIMNRYVCTLQKFLVRLSARTLKFFDDYNYAITTNMVDLKTWFFSEIYDHLYEHERVSNKMILLFRLVQEDMDERFFNIIDSKYRELIRRHGNAENGDKYSEILDELYREIRVWFEVFIYNILAVQLNCSSIRNEIFEDFDIPPDAMCCGNAAKDDEFCKHCPLAGNGSGDCQRNCVVHQGVLKYGENIMIVVTDELVEDDKWLKNLLSIVEKYHLNMKDIRFTFDFRMYDRNRKYYFRREMKELVELADVMFGKVQITNWQGVEFNLYEDTLSRFLKGECK